ncbi:hypothetical protein FKR81_39635 [Lentzea tibetensis]|uniref:Uncharacterized protein n=1 Tax=Lentzea tibetensis TaxID=2591470 RepID=A0A563EG51_9PSEU|nr:hypothetical protein [Lentzea tibetensis]TWP45196.1 hypothetical protein FKR81_39635 [Lentzea tibetensis]
MPNEDKRRRLDGATTTQLSVAELIARREAETQEIPVITDAVIADIEDDTNEPTIRFTAVTPKPRKATTPGGRELHITELLRREGRAEDAAETGGFAVGKLVAAASGGVVLCGTVAFGASSWLSSPDERPLAEVRFDERVQARGSSDNGVVKIPTKTQDQQVPGTESAEETQQAQPRVAPYTQQQQQQKPGTQTPAPTEEQTSNQTPSEPSTPPATTTPPSSETPTPPSSTSPPPPQSSSTPTPPPSSSTPPPSSTPTAPVKVDLGVLDPLLGGFDFFAPA